MERGEEEKMKSRQEFLLRTRPPLHRASCKEPTLWRSYLSPSEGLFITDNQNGSSVLTASQQLQVMIEIICSTCLIMRHNTTKRSIMKTMKVAGGGERGPSSVMMMMIVYSMMMMMMSGETSRSHLYTFKWSFNISQCHSFTSF